MRISIGLSNWSSDEYDNATGEARAALVRLYEAAGRKELNNDRTATWVEYRHGRTGKRLVIVRRESVTTR